tara:strand:+ start:544 stop:1374 length:831 start_codon:yes stop_codon:yes gene_type:complete
MLRERVITGVILAGGGMFFILALPTTAIAVAIALICIIAGWEWLGLAGTDRARIRLTYGCALVGFTGLTCLLFIRYPALLLLPALVWSVLSAWVIVTRVRSVTPGTQAGPMLGAVVIVPALAMVPLLHGSGRQGPTLLLVLCLIVWAGDIGAYFVGKTWGRIALAPTISPGKTVEGTLGGVLAGTAVGSIAWLLLVEVDLGLVALAATVALVATVSVVGDLVESMVKRAGGRKDSGHILPGHGGVLDRIDSFIGALPIYALAVTLLAPDTLTLLER